MSGTSVEKKRKALEDSETRATKKSRIETKKTSGSQWHPHDLLANLCGDNSDRSKAICNLLDAGNSIPFVARYRKAVTGGMLPDQLRTFQEKYETLKQVQEKGSKLLLAAAKEGKLDAQFRLRISGATTLDEIEILSVPFKTENKGTLASRARKIGLEEAAVGLMSGGDCTFQDLRSLVDMKVEGRKTLAEVECGVRHIIADVVAHNKETLEFATKKCDEARLFIESSKAKETKAAAAKREKERVDSTKYDLYFKFSCPVANLKPHQILALNRGEKNKVLSVKISFPGWFEGTYNRFCIQQFMQTGKTHFPAKVRLLKEAIEEAYKKFVIPWLSRRLRASLSSDAEKASIQAFCDNLRNMLLERPVREKVIMGMDPGFSHGCKLAIVSDNGAVLFTGKIFPDLKKKNVSGKDLELLQTNIGQHCVDVIAIGNGIGCRETEAVISMLIKSGAFPRKITYTIANEAGASIYSCSDSASQDNPNLDPSVVGAITIARRVQDPLSEYVKTDAWSLGIGMYQHDLCHARLKRSTESVVEECVSFVGVDINYAPLHILRKVTGVGESIAKAIVAWREKNGRFACKEQLRKVKGIGQVTYQQLAGFVRIYPRRESKSDGNTEPLDALLIHPESYATAKLLVNSSGFSVKDLGQPRMLAHFRGLLKEGAKNERLLELAARSDSDVETVLLIVEALSQQLESDMREESSTGPLFRESVSSPQDLKPGIVLEGKVMNVTTFGAFVDIGVGRSGLVHISKMNKMQPSLGQKVRVQFLSLDPAKGHIKLSLEEIL